MNTLLERSRLLFIGLLTALFLLVCFSFSFSQNLWVDESTQLSGLTLSITDLYFWLSGLIENPFLVPADRMPVLGYLLGLLWGNVFGFDVLTMRWLSIFCVLAGILALIVYCIKKNQIALLLAALIFLCLSPNLTVIAVEIRSYAFFFFLSVLVAITYLDILKSSEQGKDVYRHLFLISFLMALASNTHFFGLLMAGAVFCSYIVVALFDKRFVITPKYIITAAIILLVGIAGIIPQVLASFAVSGDANSVTGGLGSLIKPLIKLVYRLVAHQSMAGITIVPWLALLLFYGVIGFSFIRYFTVTKLALVLVLALGVVVAFVANIALSSFDAVAPHYNIWMLPFLALLFGLCVKDILSPFREIIIICLCVFWGVGQYQLAFAGEKYAHTRFNEISIRVNKSLRGGDKVAVIYNRGMAKTWFAGVYQFQGKVDQYAFTDSGYDDLYTREIDPKPFDLEKYDVVITAYGVSRYTDELVGAESISPLPDNSPVYKQFPATDSSWKIINSGAYMAQESADILVYKKTP